MDTTNIEKWMGDSKRWIDEDLRDRIERAPVFAVDARDPPAAPPSTA